MISLRNSLRPVNRLPPEVIALCASFVSHTDPRPIVSLTHVCRYWRKAITSSPRNWTSIGSEWPQLVPLCLERTGVAPLTIDITVSDTEWDTIFLDALLPHTSRIAHLTLTGYPSIEVLANVIPSFFASTIHTLTSLKLQQSAEPLEPFPASAPPTFPLSWGLSKLKSLCLTRTPLYPALRSITSLVELKLVGYTTPFQFGKFIGFLRSNPDLELVVLDIQFVETPASVFTSRIVPLVCLRQLSFTCAHAIDAKGLISSISFPRGVLLEVFGSETNQETDICSFLPSPPTTIRKLLTPITTIKHQDAPTGELHLFGNNSRFSFRSSNPSPNRTFGFSPFTTTTVREFHTNVNPYHKNLLLPLSQLPALETLVLIDVTSFSTHALSFLADEPVLCPSLKTIAFLDCNLGPTIIKELGEVVARRKNSVAAWLHRVVIVHRAGKLPNHTLLHQLRQFVPRVDVGIGELPDLS